MLGVIRLYSNIHEQQYSKYFCLFGLLTHAILNILGATGIFPSLSEYSWFDIQYQVSLISFIILSSPLLELIGCVLILNSDDVNSAYMIGWFGMMLGPPPSSSEPLFFLWAIYCGILFAFWVTPLLLRGSLVEKYDENEDWTDDDYSSPKMSNEEDSGRNMTVQPSHPGVGIQGVTDDNGQEWLEHPAGSTIWYWRNKGTDEWVQQQ